MAALNNIEDVEARAKELKFRKQQFHAKYERQIKRYFHELLPKNVKEIPGIFSYCVRLFMALIRMHLP